MEEKKKKDKGHGGMIAGAAGGLAVGALGGALVEHAVGECYHVRFLECHLLFPIANITLLSLSTQNKKIVKPTLIQILLHRPRLIR